MLRSLAEDQPALLGWLAWSIRTPTLLNVSAVIELNHCLDSSCINSGADVHSTGTHPDSYRQLGKSDLVVSEVCLGTMTWGEQNSDEEAFDQLNLAYDEFGVNFIVSYDLLMSLVCYGLLTARCFASRGSRLVDIFSFFSFL